MLAPSLAFFADFHVAVASPILVTSTADGMRRMVPILGGSIRGPSIEATILAAGEDTQFIKPDGYTTLDARYVARIEGGGYLFIANTGVRYGDPDVMAKITRGESVDPNEVYFRTTMRFETDVPDLNWVMKPLFLGVGARYPDRVSLSVYRVD